MKKHIPVVFVLLLLAINSFTININAVEKAKLEDGVLTVSGVVFNQSVNTTAEYDGSYSTYNGRNGTFGYSGREIEAPYDHYREDYNDDTGEYKKVYYTHSSNSRNVVVTTTYTSPMNIYIPTQQPTNTSYTTVRGGPYQSIDSDRADGTPIINLGVISSVPSGYYNLKQPYQVITTAKYTDIPLETKGKYVIDCTNLNGIVQEYKYTPVNKIHYYFENPVFLRPSNLSLIAAGLTNNNIPAEQPIRTGKMVYQYPWGNNPSSTVAYYHRYDSSSVTTSAFSQEYLSTLRYICANGIPYFVGTDTPNSFSYVYSMLQYTAWSESAQTNYGGYWTHLTDYKHYISKNITTADNGSNESKRLYATLKNDYQEFIHTSIGNSSQTYEEAVLKDCVSTNTIKASVPITINGGNYQGSPAINSNNVTIFKGTITDNSGNSTFIVGPDSIDEASTSGNKTVHTVKLINPPIIIDWADFPGWE